jgi:hypothetical protein
MAPEADKRSKALLQGRQGRTIAIVMAATIVVWVTAQFAGARLGLTGPFVLVLDLAALAAFVWALAATWRLSRTRRD